MLKRSTFASIGCLLLASCTSVNLIHDPQTGIIDRDQVRGFIKSVRCELKTFYELNWRNSKGYAQADEVYQKYINDAKKLKDPAANAAMLAKAASIRDDAVSTYPHFLLSAELLGGVFLDLKVIDTIGLGAGDTNTVYKHTLDPTHSFSWAIAPTANTQNTYEMNYSFVIDQSTGIVAGGHDDDFKCYASLDNTIDLYQLADGQYREHERFTRILVNGVKPLAVWLLDNSRDLWENFRAKQAASEPEQIFPLQMNYNFQVQITAGVDVRYSLTAPLWSPAQFGGVASSAQTSQLQIFLNGVDASLPAGTKTGTAANDGGKGTPKPIGKLNRQLVAAKQKILATSKQLTVAETKLDEMHQRTGIKSQTELEDESKLADQVKKLKEEKARLESRQKELERRSAAVQRTRRPIGHLIYPPALPPP